MYKGKEIIVFGNGLGRALCNERYMLETAIRDYWENNSDKDSNAIDLIKDCLPQSTEMPTGEDDFDKIHMAAASCAFLAELTTPTKWLQDNACSFHETLRNFIFQVASYFDHKNQALPKSFIIPLINYIKQTNNHVATLNYDPLIYTPFCTQKILGTYDVAHLVDGMQKGNGFSLHNLLPLWNNHFGLYLHLHGSPRFIEDKNGKITKLDADEFYNGKIDGIVGKHIVLTHIKHKKSVIDASEVLSEYWVMFNYLLGEVTTVTLFGYSGEDIR